jgi:quercetin dioxygenase-like cupin family protein
MTKDTSDIYVTRNSIAIGGQSGWHSHPGPSLITVTVGTITAYESTDPACSPTTYHAGEGFVDYGDHAHLLRNESGSAAETVAVQFLPTGATRRIDEQKPTNCTF